MTSMNTGFTSLNSYFNPFTSPAPQNPFTTPPPELSAQQAATNPLVSQHINSRTPSSSDPFWAHRHLSTSSGPFGTERSAQQTAVNPFLPKHAPVESQPLPPQQTSSQAQNPPTNTFLSAVQQVSDNFHQNLQKVTECSKLVRSLQHELDQEFVRRCSRGDMSEALAWQKEEQNKLDAKIKTIMESYSS